MFIPPLYCQVYKILRHVSIHQLNFHYFSRLHFKHSKAFRHTTQTISLQLYKNIYKYISTTTTLLNHCTIISGRHYLYALGTGKQAQQIKVGKTEMK